MATLTSLTDIATSALAADQYALNTTANNVANQNTPGYTREVVSWQAGDTVNVGGQAEAQPPTVSETSQRDRVLEQRVQQQTQDTSASGARSSVLTSIEGIFSLSSSSTSSADTPIGTALNFFFSSLTALSTNPADASTRQGVLSAAGNLASAFNSASSQLSSISSSIGSELTSSTSEVNSLTKTIASLNAQIASQSPNSDAGTLEDQRQNAIAQLSGLIGLDQITTENNGITLTTTSGAVLVTGSTSSNISVSNTGSGFQVTDATGNNVSAGLQGGSIGGLLTAQSTDLPAAANALDQLAYTLGSAINAQNEAGNASDGTPGQAIFSLPTTATGAAGAISVIPTSVTAIATAATDEGSTGNTNALALANVQNTVGGNGLTFAGTYAALIGQVGNSASSVNAENTGQQATLTTLTSQRDSLSAVSLDEEASNLTVYQRSYQAAAKIFSVADSLAVSALNLGEQTTVS
ncbi:flagellar hook-associated protein FlgK [Granulicella sp. WH15]|uniref:flagellar hook-associated protein FlgK n=1 Tax=Granulicella sp. WH15 TaxID=2602070 RepID=UPI0013668AB1|nr:flagellar hook-associated protein FlgK [Granulicella sp. WH15]QHN03745.1 flagellar hook-associated protein FlgK [Granulicella sp. WH15]